MDSYVVRGETAVAGPAPVSVIVPCFQCADVVARAVASVARQQWRPAEIVLVDDASPDYGRTWSAIDRIASEYESGWVRTVRLTRNGGPAAARNAGWSIATQPLIAFLDADDEWLPEKVNVQARWMLAHPHVPLSGHARPFRGTSGTGSRDANVRPGAVPEARRVSRTGLLLKNRFHTSGVMLRRNAVLLRFPEHKHRSEDYLLWLQLAWTGHALWELDTPLALAHKPHFGGGGLSGNLWAMERGELDTYLTLARTHGGVAAVFPFLAGYSLAKHALRVLRVNGQRWVAAAGSGR